VRRSHGATREVEDAIDVATVEGAEPTSLQNRYDELLELLDISKTDDAVLPAVEATLAEIRHRQEQEAERLRAAYERSLAMPINAGREAIAQLDALLDNYANLVSDDHTA